MQLNPDIFMRFSGSGESWSQMTDRIAEAVGCDRAAQLEIRQLLRDGVLVPGGQIWRGAGRAGRILYNCFVTNADSGEPAADIAARITDWTRRGCGVGVNVSEWCRCRRQRATALTEIVHAIAVSQHSLWQRGETRTATMVNVDFGTPGLRSVCESLQLHPVYRHLNIGVMVRDRDMLSLDDVAGASARPFDTGALRELAEVVWRSGNPGLVFQDRVNRDHPFEETLDACNPCAEQYLRPHEGCNLASINLAGLVGGHQFDWQRYREAIRVGIRFLDSVVDASEFPSEEAKRLAHQRRRVGLGVTGWASALLAMGVDYESTHAVQLAVALAAELRAIACMESEALAARMGAFPEATRSPLSPPRRNAYLLSVAPAGAISVLWGVSSGIEPIYAPTVYKGRLKAHMVRAAPTLLKAAYDMSPQHHVAMTAAWQQHVDGGISKTVNVAASATVDDVLHVFCTAWRSGCKGISIFRNGSRRGALSVESEKRPIEGCACM